ncbi:MAG: hypothetical protein M3071_03170, partial [Actinomycetota bacterium]|nr:hypothetical protein [Actinomycetota bacterium]
MSTLLERMVQRTRGPLSSVEPLARPPLGTSTGFANDIESVVDASPTPPDAPRAADPARPAVPGSLSAPHLAR